MQFFHNNKDVKKIIFGRKTMLVSQNATRRNYKDSVFVDLFAHDVLLWDFSTKFFRHTFFLERWYEEIFSFYLL